MSKKAILSTLLISSALLGTTVAANAATSAVKPESKLVTVEKSNAKIYKNSKLQESKKAKKGTVYKVNGYRDINGKKYYRVYQEDTKGKVVYKGYILDKDTKVLKGQKPAKKDRFVGVTKADQTAWKSLYFNKKIKTYDGTKHASNFEVKYTYKIGDKTYYSLYRGEKWMGYMNASGFKVLTPQHLAEDKQAYEVIKDYETYNDIYFTEKGQLKVGEKVKVKNIYTFGNGRHYGSLYNEEGKWIGYANMHALKAVEASTPEEPGKPDEPTTPEKPDTKPEETELEKAKKAAEEAIKKAEAALATSNASKESKEAAQKVIDAAKETVKGDNLEAIKKIPAQLDEAIKALQPADVKALEDAIKRAEELVKTPGLTGTDEVKAKLDVAKKVLEDAKKGTASKEQIKAATDELNKAIAGVKLDTSDLQKALEGAKQLAKDYYLTKDQEAKLNEEFAKIQKVVDNDKTEKKDVDAAKAKLEKIADALKVQPTYAQGQALSEAIAKANKLKAHGEVVKVLFEDFDGVKEAYKEATDTMTELKKDAQFGENTATKELTAQQVSDIAKKLNDALDNLKINATNTKWFYDEAKKAIDKLDEADKATPNEALKAFEDAAKKGTAKDINEILDTAKALVNAIDTAQNNELQAAIDKAERIIKANDEAKEGSDFYTDETYKSMKDALATAKKALELTPATTTKATMKDKENAEDALNKAINDLKIKDWEYSETNDQVTLVSYTGGYKKDAKIVVPGMLKDKQVVLADQKKQAKADATSKKLFPSSDEKGFAGTVSVIFKAVDGHKVKAQDLYGAMINNTTFGTVDVTGLDTSATTNFNGLFMNDFYLKEVKGIDHLVTSAATDLGGMLCNTTVGSIDVSGWDTSNVTNMDRLFNKSNVTEIKGIEKWDVSKVEKFTSIFGGTKGLTTLDLSGWKMNASLTKDANTAFGTNEYNMFVSRDKKEESKINEVTVPNEKHTAELIVTALINAAGQAGGISHDVTVKTPDGKVIGTVKYEKNHSPKGEWHSVNEKPSTPTTPSESTTDSSTQK